MRHATEARTSDDAGLVTFIIAGTMAVGICSALGVWAIGNATITPTRCLPYSISDCTAAIEWKP